MIVSKAAVRTASACFRHAGFVSYGINQFTFVHFLISLEFA